MNASRTDGCHDFDFFAGSWDVRHRSLDVRLAGSTRWESFGGTCDVVLLLGGNANVDDNVIELPSGTYRAATFRVYEPETATWSIWWVDGRTAKLDTPVRGRFTNGIGTFYAEETLDGKPIRVRFTWSDMTPSFAHWEQAFSGDGGETWETNWTMDFTRRIVAA